MSSHFSCTFRNPRSWAVCGLLLFVAALSLQYYSKVRHTDRETRSAILRWRDQIHDLRNGRDIWETANYPNPPMMVLLLEPLAHLPPLAGTLAWFYLKIGMAVLAAAWCFRMVEDPARPFPFWGKALAVLLSLRLLAGDLTHGNVNIFILFIVVASLAAFQKRRDLAAGLLLALGVACKLTPALFVPYFLWKRAWKTLAACGVGLLLFFLVIPGYSLGWEQNLRYLGNWVDRMVVPYLVRGEVVTDHNNQSLPAVVYRLLTHSPSFSTYVNDLYTPVEFHNLLELDRADARWVVRGCMALFAGLVVWACRTPRHGPGGRMAAEFGLVVLGMLLFSERTWKHHCVTLLLPFTVVAYYLAAFWRERGLRNYLLTTLGGAVLLMASTSTGVWDSQGRPGKMAQVYGAYTGAFLLLLVSLVVLVRRKERAPGVTAGGPLVFQASISGTTEPPPTRGSGLPTRSVTVVSGSIPRRW